MDYKKTIDLVKRYWQIPLEAQDKEKITFTTPLGLLQFNGMTNGPDCGRHQIGRVRFIRLKALKELFLQNQLALYNSTTCDRKF